MASEERSARPTGGVTDVHQQVASAIGLLERLAADWSLLDGLPAEERARLHRVVAGLSVPDPRAGRTRAKLADRERRAHRIRQEDVVLHETGIRVLRRRPMVTTPTPALAATPEETAAIQARPGSNASVAERHCYICKQGYSRVHDF